VNNDLENEIRALVAKVIKKPEAQVGLDTNLFTDLGIDSLLGIEIFAALDKKYKVDVPESKLREVQTLRDIIRIVEEALKGGK